MRGKRDVLAALLLIAVPVLFPCCAINRKMIVPVPTIAYPHRPETPRH
jgi:hypothetical protein